ncbi:GNAT family N-acetyltransferase [Pantoea sp. Ap-967]|uniref:GNAT family N-acetyltransferase n=1 Tax=Pantoea sp. Ap-967 TaxID=2608362 RepID=UPI001421A536|nr:GNAT family N-acetyltransferase [Pantoea sp. Ap-967]NIE78383.1 GNAT family N-acetyltransferase [Pantoea sp. Ap-967]
MTHVIRTARLLLCPLRAEQAPRLAELGNDPLIAAHTANFPSPYTLACAQAYIALATESGASNPVFAIELRDGGLIGVINLKLSLRHRSGHLGYWMGAGYRGAGYMSEAARAVVDHGFRVLQLHRVESACFGFNEASARVLENAGLVAEGCKRQAFLKDGQYQDLLLFGAVSKAPY